MEVVVCLMITSLVVWVNFTQLEQALFAYLEFKVEDYSILIVLEVHIDFLLTVE